MIRVYKPTKNYIASILMRFGQRAVGHLEDNPVNCSIENYRSEHFYPGHDSFIDKSYAFEHECRWSLGFASMSLIPSDIFSGKYYLAGFMMGGRYILQNFPEGNAVEEVLDDMKVRVVCLDDGSGRGSVVFAVIDAIGVSNADVRIIRSRLSDFAKERNIVSINICSTHCHSCIDTQGLWSSSFSELKNKLKEYKKYRSDNPNGYQNRSFMEILYSRTAAAIKAAVEDMTCGTLYYNETDIRELLSDKRPGERGLKVGDEPSVLTNLSKFTFVPDDISAKPTILVNMNAHPCTVGLETYCEDTSSINFGEALSSGKQLSGDYVAYIDKEITSAGYNLFFVNGAIMGTYISGGNVEPKPGFTPQRYERAAAYGKEIASLLLSMKLEDATAVSPFLNIRCAEVITDTDNPIIIAIGKLGITHNTILRSPSGYKSVTETGYVEIGEKKVLLTPGELCPDLVTGRYSVKAEYSVSGLDFPLPSFSEAAGFKNGENILVFGLANDATGYIMPDTDFALIRYHETLSFGKSFASSLVSTFCEIISTYSKK